MILIHISNLRGVHYVERCKMGEGMREILKRGTRSMRCTLMREKGRKEREGEGVGGMLLYTTHLYGILSRHADLKRLLRRS